MQTMTEDQLAAAIASRPAEKVTKEHMKEHMEIRVSEIKFHKLGPTLTHCAIHLDNGFIVTGESACVSPENYDQKIGEDLAYKAAFQRLWPLFGFLLERDLIVETVNAQTLAERADPG